MANFIGIPLGVLFSVAAVTAADAGIDRGDESLPHISFRGDMFIEPAVRVAATRYFNFFNPMPFPVKIKVYGSASQGFPKVYTAPAPPAPFAPVPYPNTSMKVRVKPQGGSWSKKFTVKWKPGPITLRSLLGM